MHGEKGVVECTFVKSDVTEAAYFSTPVLLGKNGVEEVRGTGELSEFEKKKLEEVCLPITRVISSYLVHQPLHLGSEV